MRILRTKEVRNILLAGLLPFIILTGVYAVFGVFPFGEKSVLICDLSEQYVDYFSGLHHAVRSGRSLWYSWSKALGGEMIGVYAFYLASPLSWLVALVPLQHMPFAMMLLILLKTAISGMTFAFYYQRVFQKKDLTAVIFSVCYALMSYNIVYGMSVMWLDGVYLLPLVLYGVEKLLKGESARYLTVVLVISFWSNYYISYMIGLYCVLYFFYRRFSAYEELKGSALWRGFGKLAGAALIAAGLTAVLLIPGFMALFSGKIQDEGAWLSSGTLFDWGDFVKKLLPGSYDTLKYDGTPNIYCGLLIVCLDILFFLSRHISGKKKLCGGLLLGFLAVSAYFALLNSVWHVFREANWFPFRNSFLLSFSMILLAAVWWQSRENALKKERAVLGVICILTVAELGWNAYTQIRKMDEEFTYQTYDSYRNMILELSPLKEEADQRTEGFYRLEKDFSRSKNDALTLDYHGVTHYSSDYHANLNELIRKLGMAQDYFWCGYDGSTPVTDSIFGIRYVISKEEAYHDYELIARSYGNILYENVSAAGLGIFADRSILNTELTKGSYLENQNRLFEALSGESNVFQKQAITVSEGETGVTVQVPITQTGEYYAEFPTYDTEEYEFSFYLNGEWMQPLYTSEKKGVICLGEYEAGEQLELTVQAYYGIEALGSPAVYRLDEKAFETGISKLQENSWTPKNYGNTLIEDTIQMEEDDILFTTIPYDKGWTVTIDGEKAETMALDDTLLCVAVEEGTHEIRFMYRPGGIYAGMLVTLGTATGILIVKITKKEILHE